MSDLNNVTILGRLTREPKIKQLNSGMYVCNFSIANNKTIRKENEVTQKANFFECTAWGKTAETINKYFQKGQRILIHGELYQNTWEDKDTGKMRSSVNITVQSFNFIEKSDKSKQETGEDYHGIGTEVQPNEVPETRPITDDDIPF
jgi:single-strand DNA-binding protein